MQHGFLEEVMKSGLIFKGWELQMFEELEHYWTSIEVLLRPDGTIRPSLGSNTLAHLHFYCPKCNDVWSSTHRRCLWCGTRTIKEPETRKRRAYGGFK